ncbi:MAG: SMP-30/gluconolactonase/LRE family protein [Rhizomicrobium sp.]|nr:SMP-30/gluconolactonase/LRE family protein [Rhizomicrobium sp.]
MQPDDTIKVGNTLGECVLWDDASAALWWTDIDGCTLYRLDWASRDLQHIRTPTRLASFGFVAGRRELVAAFDDGFALFDPDTGERSAVLRPEGLGRGMRMNDGRVDRQGRLWAGAMVMDAADPLEAKLYAVQDGAIRTRLDSLGITNGLCWSPEGTALYLADSRRRIIWRYDFDVREGALGVCHEFARIDGFAEPDGACVDAEGYLWSAMWGGDCIVRYAPDGRIDRVLEVPVCQPTCVTFGGPNRELLFVTSARLGLSAAATGAGDVLVYNMKIRGLPESRFNLDNWPEQSRFGAIGVIDRGAI